MKELLDTIKDPKWENISIDAWIVYVRKAVSRFDLYELVKSYRHKELATKISEN
ncbi:MAG: hypothetical protein AAFX87_17790 [Bacteroidota bacterium]